VVQLSVATPFPLQYQVAFVPPTDLEEKQGNGVPIQPFVVSSMDKVERKCVCRHVIY
jgi:hypothetical protein